MVKIPSSVHIRLEEGLALRKTILETALVATETLQTFKQYKRDNIDKKKLIAQFKKEISALKQTVHELEFKDLPQELNRKIEKPEPVIHQTEQEIKEEVKEVLEAPVEKTQLERDLENLKAQIDSIKI